MCWRCFFFFAIEIKILQYFMKWNVFGIAHDRCPLFIARNLWLNLIKLIIYGGSSGIPKNADAFPFSGLVKYWLLVPQVRKLVIWKNAIGMSRASYCTHSTMRGLGNFKLSTDKLASKFRIYRFLLDLAETYNFKIKDLM